MRIVVCGDTHGRIEELTRELERLKNIDYLIHTGDFYQDGIALGRELGIKTRVVVGNCDLGVKGPREEIFTLAGRRFLLTHGHLYRVKSHLNSLKFRAEEVGAHVVIFGHTHTAYCEMVENILFINPGSTRYSRFSQRGTYVLIEADDERLQANIVEMAF
ncbi:MAG: metallophosphoesterase [Syntrophomonadaceae bacterium]|nr:metallophosphoesterase [Syntrophomonadaceae bacterium]